MNENDLSRRREDMVQTQIVARGVRSPQVLAAMRTVPRDAFVPEALREFAHGDVSLPVAPGPPLARPCVVAEMADALVLQGGDKVLEIGTGCGYVTAVLSCLARDVYSVESSDHLATTAAARLATLKRSNVHLRHADPEAGWPEHAPFDAILVNLGGHEVPAALKQQLSIGGRLVMPVGVDPDIRELVRVTRVSEHGYRTEDMADLRVGPTPDDGANAVVHAGPMWSTARRAGAGALAALAGQIAAAGERFATPGTADLEALLRRIGDARVVLLGESTNPPPPTKKPAAAPGATAGFAPDRASIQQARQIRARRP